MSISRHTSKSHSSVLEWALRRWVFVWSLYKAEERKGTKSGSSMCASFITGIQGKGAKWLVLLLWKPKTKTWTLTSSGWKPFLRVGTFYCDDCNLPIMFTLIEKPYWEVARGKSNKLYRSALCHGEILAWHQGPFILWQKSVATPGVPWKLSWLYRHVVLTSRKASLRRKHRQTSSLGRVT